MAAHWGENVEYYESMNDWIMESSLPMLSHHSASPGLMCGSWWKWWCFLSWHTMLYVGLAILLVWRRFCAFTQGSSGVCYLTQLGEMAWDFGCYFRNEHLSDLHTEYLNIYIYIIYTRMPEASTNCHINLCLVWPNSGVSPFPKVISRQIPAINCPWKNISRT